MWDVTLIANDRGLLRQLVSNVPYENQVFTLRNRLHRKQVIGQKPGCWEERNLEKALQVREKRRARADEQAAKPLSVVGAFVTFEDERATHAAMAVWGPGGVTEGLCGGPPDYARAPAVDPQGQVVRRLKLSAHPGTSEPGRLPFFSFTADHPPVLPLHSSDAGGCDV